jgi:hypothetical protein
VTWTYSGNPANSTLDAVRFLMGDTDTTDQLLSNEELSWLITTEGTAYYAAAEACRAVAAKFARQMSRSVGGLSADFAAKYRQYLELADRLETEARIFPVALYISGYTRSDKEAVEENTDRESTFSRKGIHDNERVYPADDDASFVYRTGR